MNDHRKTGNNMVLLGVHGFKKSSLSVLKGAVQNFPTVPVRPRLPRVSSTLWLHAGASVCECWGCRCTG